MGLETATYISDLNSANPTSSDAKSSGDDHIRLLKSAVKATFPNVSGAVTPTHTEINYVDGVTSAIQTQIDSKGAHAGQTWTGSHDFTGATVALGTATLGADVSAVNHKITNLANATNAADAANLQTVQALVSGGGTPASIPITSLGVGTANDGEVIMRSGSALIGKPLPEVVTVNVTGTTHSAAAGTRALLLNVAATAVTAPSAVDGAEFEVLPANGLKTNTIDFGAATVIGPTGSATGVITLNLGAPMRVRYNSTISKWVML